MYAFVGVVLKPCDRVFQMQLAALQRGNREVVGRGMCNCLGQFSFKRPVLLFQIHKLRWHRHTIGLHKSIFPSRMEFCHESRGKSMGDLLCNAINPLFSASNFGLSLDAVNAPGLIRAMNQDDERELRAQLAQLQQEHRDLDVAIEALHNVPGSDLLQVQRLKKRKLVLRDRISFIEDQLTPDIIA
jgi:hypothetical protein